MSKKPKEFVTPREKTQNLQRSTQMNCVALESRCNEKRSDDACASLLDAKLSLTS